MGKDMSEVMRVVGAIAFIIAKLTDAGLTVHGFMHHGRKILQYT